MPSKKDKCIHNRRTYLCPQCKVIGKGGTSLCEIKHKHMSIQCKKLDLNVKSICAASVCGIDPKHYRQLARCKLGKESRVTDRRPVKPDIFSQQFIPLSISIVNNYVCLFMPISSLQSIPDTSLNVSMANNNYANREISHNNPIIYPESLKNDNNGSISQIVNNSMISIASIDSIIYLDIITYCEGDKDWFVYSNLEN